MLADDVRYVLGVDTHADTHALALVETKTHRTHRTLTISARGAATARHSGSPAAKRLAAACGRSRARAPTARGSPASSRSEASGCSRSSARGARAGAVV